MPPPVPQRGYPPSTAPRQSECLKNRAHLAPTRRQNSSWLSVIECEGPRPLTMVGSVTLTRENTHFRELGSKEAWLPQFDAFC